MENSVFRRAALQKVRAAESHSATPGQFSRGAIKPQRPALTTGKLRSAGLLQGRRGLPASQQWTVHI